MAICLPICGALLPGCPRMVTTVMDGLLIDLFCLLGGRKRFPPVFRLFSDIVIADPQGEGKVVRRDHGISAEPRFFPQWSLTGIPFLSILRSALPFGSERITQRPGLRGSKGGDSPVFPEKGGELWGDSRENSFRFFPLWKRGMKGEFTAFQKAKLLPTKLYAN